MAFVITWEAWDGEVKKSLLDEEALLHRLLPDRDDRTFRCLGFVDEYGDTIFNRIQMPDLIAELERVRETTDPNRKAFIDEILDLARLCKEAPQTQIRFNGD